MAEDYPTINGHAPSFGDIELAWGDKKYTGFKAINYRHTLDVEPMDGQPDGPIDMPRGAYRGCEGDITVTRKTFDTMIADQGAGYMQKPFDVTVQIATSPTDTGRTDYLLHLRLTEEGFDGERGGDGLYVTRNFKGLMLAPNGVSPVANPVLEAY